MSPRIAWIVAATLVVSACGGGGGSPTAPSGTGGSGTTQTRIINVTGNLAFGDVNVGSSRDATFTISNSGNATLTVSGLSVSGGLASVLSASWTSGTIAAGASQSVTLRFQPTSAGSFSGTLSVTGDQTSGSNTIAITANAVSSFSGNFTGGHVITQCNGTGSAQDLICSAARGAFKVGSNMRFAFNLTQNGNAVTGTGDLGGTVGPVTGTVNNGVLTLTGTLRDTQGFTAVITAFSTTVSGNTMSGTVSYTLTFSGLPGNAGIVANLSNVTRQ